MLEITAVPHTPHLPNSGDTTRPRVHCETCDRVRYCEDHMRAEFPPDATKKWLLKTCQRKPECKLQYWAGVIIRKGPRLDLGSTDNQEGGSNA